MNNLISILLILGLTGCAGTYQLNPKGKKKSIEETQAFELGYKKALQENSKKWENKGMNKAKEALSHYADDIKSIEAGKVARDKNYLEETRAIVIKNPDGSVTIKTVGGKLKNSLNANQVIDYYKENKSLLPIAASNNLNPYGGTENKKPLLLKESFQLSSESYIEHTKGKIADNKALIKKQTVALDYNDLSKGVIDLYGLNCTHNSKAYHCSFKNSALKNSFCKETGVCK